MSLHGSVKSVVKNEMKQANEKNGIFSIPRFQRTYTNIANQLSKTMTMNEISTMATYATSVMTKKAYEIAVVYKQLAEDGQVTESTSKFYDRETLKSANNVLEKWKMLLANDPNNTPSKDDRDRLIFILASWSCSLVKIKGKDSDAASTYSSDDHTRSANTKV